MLVDLPTLHQQQHQQQHLQMRVQRQHTVQVGALFGVKVTTAYARLLHRAGGLKN
jgi:hypothetical protein